MKERDQTNTKRNENTSHTYEIKDKMLFKKYSENRKELWKVEIFQCKQKSEDKAEEISQT